MHIQCIRSHQTKQLKQKMFGKYNFLDALRDTSKSLPGVRLDRATFSGLIEVHNSRFKGAGRSVFTIGNVAAGQLLLCEKACLVTFSDHERSPTSPT